MNQSEFSTDYSSTSNSIENSSELNSSFEDNKKSSLLKVYYSMFYQFKYSGRPELTERMLRRIMMSRSIPRDLQMKPLYLNLSGIIDELMMNEIEIALWAIILEKIVWKNFETFSEQNLLFSAYKAKLYLNEKNIKPIKVYLMAKIEDFKKNFNVWQEQYEDKFQIDLKSINSKMSHLKRFKGVEIDYGALSYNYYVDVMLQSAVPYSARNQKEILQEKEKPIEKKKNRIYCKLIKDSKKKREPKLEKIRKIRKIDENNKREAFNHITIKEKHDLEIEKIEKYCDGLIENDDLNPDDFSTAILI